MLVPMTPVASLSALGWSSLACAHSARARTNFDVSLGLGSPKACSRAVTLLLSQGLLGENWSPAERRLRRLVAVQVHDVFNTADPLRDLVVA